MPPESNAWRYVLAFLGFGLLAAWFTWPLAVLGPETIIGAPGDGPTFVWNLWWFRYALMTLGKNPFHCDYVFHPVGANLAYHDFTVTRDLLGLAIAQCSASCGPTICSFSRAFRWRHWRWCSGRAGWD